MQVLFSVKATPDIRTDYVENVDRVLTVR